MPLPKQAYLQGRIVNGLQQADHAFQEAPHTPTGLPELLRRGKRAGRERRRARAPDYLRSSVRRSRHAQNAVVRTGR